MAERKTRFLPLLIGIALLCATSVALAEPPVPENPAAIEQELRMLQGRLSSVREQAMAVNPSLQRRQDALQDQVMSRMRDEGVFPRKQIREIQEMARALASGDLAEEERQALLVEYQAARDALLAARRIALEDDRIVAAQRAFSDELMAAMVAIDPEASAMAERFELLRDALAGMRNP